MLLISNDDDYDADANGDNNNATMFNSVENLAVGCDRYGRIEDGEVESSQWSYYNNREEDQGYYGFSYYNGEEQWYNNEEYGYNEENYDSYGFYNYGCYSDESCYEEQWYDARETFNDEGYGANEYFDHDVFYSDGYGCAGDGGDSFSNGGSEDSDSNCDGGEVGRGDRGGYGGNDGDRSDNSDGASASEGANSDGDDDNAEGRDGRNQDAPVTCFKTCCFAYPLSHIGKSHLEIGNKIILPCSALEQLMNIGVDFPMLFKVENSDNRKTSHCGVLEFSGEEGMAAIPEWMMNNLSVEKGSLISVESVALDKATYVKLQPHKMAFLDIRNPKSVLENAFCLGYSCLTVGDTIVIMNEGQKMYLDVVDAKPSNAVCMIDTDVEVDFAIPLDFKEPDKPVPKIEGPTKFVPFTGTARRLSDTGKSSGESSSIVFSGGSLKSTCSEIKPSSDEKALKPFTGKMYRLIDS